MNEWITLQKEGYHASKAYLRIIQNISSMFYTAKNHAYLSAFVLKGMLDQSFHKNLKNFKENGQPCLQ